MNFKYFNNLIFFKQSLILYTIIITFKPPHIILPKDFAGCFLFSGCLISLPGLYVCSHVNGKIVPTSSQMLENISLHCKFVEKKGAADSPSCFVTI